MKKRNVSNLSGLALANKKEVIMEKVAIREKWKIEIRMKSGNKILLQSSEYLKDLCSDFVSKKINEKKAYVYGREEYIEPWGDVWDEVIFRLADVESIAVTKRSKEI